ncbi:hypothetical protein IIM_00230 [Bacillus cereus VD107]|nr:hypothetical protein IIM_00230 [Bacillus cereus VD107]
MKKLIHFFLFISIILILGGCTMENKQEQEKIISKAKETAILHFKETKNVDIVVTETQFAPNDVGGIFVMGHVKGDTNRKITATINYDNNYEVESITWDPEK